MRKSPGDWTIKLLTVCAAWFVAFLVVLAMLSAFGRELESLSYVLNAFVFTAVLVPLMGLVVMPTLGVAITRWERRRSDAEHQRALHRG